MTEKELLELTEKAAKYDHLLPYLCKTCGGYGLVDRRSKDDPLGAEPCPDCNQSDDMMDAARYRWLRDNCVREWVSRLEPTKGKKTLDIEFDADGHDLDSAIDAAMADSMLRAREAK